jgi:hypothetical protein
MFPGGNSSFSFAQRGQHPQRGHAAVKNFNQNKSIRRPGKAAGLSSLK